MPIAKYRIDQLIDYGGNFYRIKDVWFDKETSSYWYADKLPGERGRTVMSEDSIVQLTPEDIGWKNENS